MISMFTLLKQWLGWGVPKEHKSTDVSVRDVTLEELKQAISQFTREKPHGVPLRVLVGEHNEIDYTLLHPYLNGIPSQSYYMSKETYDIFTNQEIARQVDQIQRAVDDYVDVEGKLPILEEDFSSRKVNYPKLSSYLKITPTIDTYITLEENLISTKEPNIH